jgi:hypothetical protein
MTYWKPLFVDGTAIDLSHLEPFDFEVIPAGGIKPVTITVKFNDHCFTEDFDATRHDAPLTIDHVSGHETRGFDRVRYELSKNLPLIIRGLDGERISSARKGNLVRVTLQDGQTYPVFFDLRLVRKSRIALFVISAFIWERSDKPTVTGGMNFNVAIAKVLRGERPKFPRA